jgi:hypothetical protein
MTVQTFRQQLRLAGFSPLPLVGKCPVLNNWQKRIDTTQAEIESWSKRYPDAGNTGVLTRLTPCFDIDILDPEAAAALEKLVRERFEEHGYILIRFGRAPKRAIPFRTDAPFRKILVKVLAPDGSAGQKLELLGDGQQVVVDGIHPDTGKAYAWHGGSPGEIKHEDLPCIHEDEARALVADAVQLLAEFGYTLPQKRAHDGKDGGADWSQYLANLADHDDLTAFAMALLRSGMSDGAVVNFLRSAVAGLQGVDPARIKRRFKEIPGMVSSARAKLEEERPEHEPPPPSTLDQVVGTFKKWLVLEDETPIYAVLGTVAANRLQGDPVWLGIVAPPSSAKTEILHSLGRLPFIEPTATLTPAALLSGTSIRMMRSTAKGGLLRKIGDFGILVLKDFGSILSMRPDTKAEIIAALREIYDGAWTRHLGTDGGVTLSWTGKIGLLFGTTEVFDDHHSIIGGLGDRFLLCRLKPSYDGQLKRALEHTGAATKAMRAELADTVGGLFESVTADPPKLSPDELRRLDDVVSLAIRLRAHVSRDRYSREIESIHGAEGPARIGLSLERLLAGLHTIGLDRDAAMRVVETIALDSTPPIRRRAFELLSEKAITTRTVAQALKLPTTTARRALEELDAQGLAKRSRGTTDDGEEKKGGADEWTLDPEWQAGRAKRQEAAFSDAA